MSSESAELRERLLDDGFDDEGKHYYQSFTKTRLKSSRWLLCRNALEIFIVMLLIYIAALLTNKTVTTCHIMEHTTPLQQDEGNTKSSMKLISHEKSVRIVI